MIPYVPGPAERWLIEELTAAPGARRRPVPRALLTERARAAGHDREAMEQARQRLRVLFSSDGLSIDPSLCAACQQYTPYVDRLHRVGLHPDCTTPITTWEWSALVAPENARPGARRQRRTWSLGHRPAGWPSVEPVRHFKTGELITPHMKACTSVFARAREGRDMCPDTVVWKARVTTGRTTSTQYWCDADLPKDLRPTADAEPLTPFL